MCARHIYIYSYVLLPYLLYHAVSRVNMVPRSTVVPTVKGGMAESPQTCFDGRRVSYKLDLGLTFGQYVEVYSGTDRTDKARTYYNVRTLRKYAHRYVRTAITTFLIVLGHRWDDAGGGNDRRLS